MVVYVDDLLITGNDLIKISRLKEALKQRFEMTDLGYASNYLRAKIVYTNSNILVHQQSYIDKLGTQTFRPPRL